MIVCHYIVGRSYVRLLVREGEAPLAYDPTDRGQVPLESVARIGIALAPPPGPLGPRPVGLGYSLIQCWLPEEEWKRWRGAGHVRSGRMALLERIEQEILELEMRPDFPSLMINREAGNSDA